MFRLAATITVVFATLVSFRAIADDEPAEHADKVATSADAEVSTESEVHGDEEPASHGEGDSHGAEASHGDDGHGDAAHSDDHGGHDAHHDPTDLSHMNAGASMNDPSEFKSDLAIWTFVVFMCLLLILGKFAWGPVTEGLDQREQSIAAMIDEAKQGQEKAAEQMKQYEAKLAAAGEEARELVAQARKDAETAKERIVAEAQEAADKQRQRALEDIETAKNVALQEVTEKGVDLAVNLAGKIVRQKLNAEDHSQLIRESMDQLASRN